MLYSVVSMRARSELVSDIIVLMMLPATLSATRAEDRSEMEYRLTDLAISLAKYHAKHGEYPESLEQLIPDFIDQIPPDIYTDDEPIYRKRRQDTCFIVSTRTRSMIAVVI